MMKGLKDLQPSSARVLDEVGIALNTGVLADVRKEANLQANRRVLIVPQQAPAAHDAVRLPCTMMAAICGCSMC